MKGKLILLAIGTIGAIALPTAASARPHHSHRSSVYANVGVAYGYGTPYGYGSSTYGNGYASPYGYGATPYGYGASPYGYGLPSYGYGTSPYGYGTSSRGHLSHRQGRHGYRSNVSNNHGGGRGHGGFNSNSGHHD